MNVILGIGCDRGTLVETLDTAIDHALQQVNIDRRAVKMLATIDKKNDEACILAVSEHNNWPIQFYPASELAKVDVPNPSKVVLKYMGTPAVAEAAAMLAANTDATDLLVEKYKYCGSDTKNATVSIVRIVNA